MVGSWSIKTSMSVIGTDSRYLPKDMIHVYLKLDLKNSDCNERRHLKKIPIKLVFSANSTYQLPWFYYKMGYKFEKERQNKRALKIFFSCLGWYGNAV